MNKINKNGDLLRFIDLYKRHEVLWNMNISLYRRNDIKIKAYESISDEMKMSVEDVKKKIKSLRTAYSAEKSKVEKSKKSGCGTDSVYIPTVFWFNEMTFLDASLMRRRTVDNSNQHDIDSLIETSMDSEANELSFSLASCTEPANVTTPTCSKKGKHSPEPKSKLDNALDQLIAINKSCSVFETFGENVGRQIKEFPEEDAYQLMADIQVMLSKRKMELLRKERKANSKVEILKPVNFQSRSPTPVSQNSNSNHSADILKAIKQFRSRASTPISQSSDSQYSSDLLRCTMSHADILEEDYL